MAESSVTATIRLRFARCIHQKSGTTTATGHVYIFAAIANAHETDSAIHPPGRCGPEAVMANAIAANAQAGASFPARTTRVIHPGNDTVSAAARIPDSPNHRS